MKDPADHNHYVPNPDIVPIVKRIFSLARNGMTPLAIAQTLMYEKATLPSELWGDRRAGKNKWGWSRQAVRKILQNTTYLGHVSNGQTKKLSYKSKKVILIPKSEQIIVKNMHEAIIDDETFEMVQKMIASRTGVRVKKHDWLLKGILRCRECGKKLGIASQGKKKTKAYYTRCNTYNHTAHLGLCTPHSNNVEKVTDVIIGQIEEKCRQFLQEAKYQKIAESSKNKILENKYNIHGEILVLKKKLSVINSMIDKIYEDKCKGLFQNEDFTRLYTKQIEDRKAIESRIKQLEEQSEKKDETQIDIKKIVKDFVEMKEITRPMLVSLIDRIEISQSKEITIYYRFNILNTTENQDENSLTNAG